MPAMLAAFVKVTALRKRHRSQSAVDDLAGKHVPPSKSSIVAAGTMKNVGSRAADEKVIASRPLSRHCHLASNVSGAPRGRA